MSQIKPFIAAVIRRCKSFFRSVKRAILWLLGKIRAFFHALLLSIRLLALRAAVFFLSFVSSCRICRFVWADLPPKPVRLYFE